MFFKLRSIVSVIQGHAHNDYEHENPLREALENGFISGSRSFNEVLNDEPKLAGLDGRPDDLKKNIPTSIQCFRKETTKKLQITMCITSIASIQSLRRVH